MNDWRTRLKSPTTTVDFSTLPFNCINFQLTYFESQLLGEYSVGIVISWKTDFVVSLSLIVFPAVKSILL